MKRLLLGVFALVLVLSLSLPCMAAEEILSVAGSKAAAGETVYLTVSLESPIKANTVGISCQFDNAVLTAQPELSKWSENATLAAFEEDNMGAWAVSNEKALSGELCVLAFQVKPGAAFDTTEVACTVKLKVNTKVVGEYTAKGTVSCVCRHSYGDWESAGAIGHERECTLCGGKNTQMHQWDDGTEQAGKGGVTIITKTCLVCKYQETMEMQTGSNSGSVVEPEILPPDVQLPQGGDTVKPQQETLPGTDFVIGEDGSITNSQTGDVVVPGNQETHDHSHETHDHSHETPTEPHNHDHEPVYTVGAREPATGWIIFGVLAVAVAAGVIFLKKR